MGDGYVKSDDSKKLLFIDANSLYVWAMSESLPYDEIKIDENNERKIYNIYSR